VFRTLNAKLMTSHLAIVAIVLVLSALATGVVITRAQRQANLARASSLAVSISERLRTQPNLATPRAEWIQRLRAAPGGAGRVLVLDARGLVMWDADAQYGGERVPLRRPVLSQPRSRTIVLRHTFSDGLQSFVVMAQLPEGTAKELGGEWLGLIVPVREAGPPWRALLRPLLAVAGLTCVLAIGLAYALSHSITRPVAQIAAAAEAMAQGDYGQTVDVRGHDEIATLGRRFSAMAEAVTRARRSQREFLANVSHDLKTPLTSIQGFSQAIIEGAVTDKAGYLRAAEIIHGEAARMLDLVGDLLELARLESGELALAPEPIDLADIVSPQVDSVRVRGRDREIRIDYDTQPDLPPVRGDPNRLAQAVANILDNAVRYADDGSTVHVELGSLSAGETAPNEAGFALGAELEGKAWMHLTVVNHGTIIAPEDQGRVFERFYRGDRSRHRTKGSGLGLAIVRETMLAHGGRVELSSSADAGTRVTLWLPALTTTS